MKFSTNKTPVEVIKEVAFGGTCFRDTYSGINGKWYKNSWKEFDDLKNIGLILWILMVCFNCILDIG